MPNRHVADIIEPQVARGHVSLELVEIGIERIEFLTDILIGLEDGSIGPDVGITITPAVDDIFSRLDSNEPVGNSGPVTTRIRVDQSDESNTFDQQRNVAIG